MPPPKPAVKIMFCVRQVWSATRGLQLDILFIMKYLFRAENRSTGGERPRPAITNLNYFKLVKRVLQNNTGKYTSTKASCQDYDLPSPSIEFH